MAEYRCLELEAVFNHKAIWDEQIKEQITSLQNKGLGPMSLFYSNNFLHSEKVIYEQGIPFLFPKSYYTYDNIQCDGQIIPIPKGQYVNLYLLGCYEFQGDFNDTIEVFSEKEKSEELKISLWPWIKAGQLLNQKDLFSFDQELFSFENKIAVLPCKNTANANVGFTFFKQSIFDKNISLDHLKLSANSGMHIFAITLELL